MIVLLWIDLKIVYSSVFLSSNNIESIKKISHQTTSIKYTFFPFYNKSSTLSLAHFLERIPLAKSLCSAVQHHFVHRNKVVG